jgi:CheY-like chemotaxis protein
MANMLSRVVRRASPELDVDAFTKPGDALERIEAASPGVLITDLVMPEHSGADLIERARGRWGQVPVVLMSAYDRIDGRMMRFETMSYLRKPFRASALIDSVDRAREVAVATLNAYARDVVRVRAFASHSGLVRVFRDDEEVGALGLHRGSLVHAEDALGGGKPAWERLMAHDAFDRGVYASGGVHDQNMFVERGELLARLNEGMA